MKLLLCPDRPNIKWCKADLEGFTPGTAVFGTAFQEQIMSGFKGKTMPEALGYMLYHGGEEITETVCAVTEEILKRTIKVEKYLPEDNTITTRMIKVFMKIFPDTPHYLICDTAFFTKIPEAAGTYAVPFEFRKQGIRKYGSNGLCHEWAYDSIVSAAGRQGIKKVVSIYVGSRTNIAAINNGRPVETSAGFTPMEGIPSLNSCGDLDPTILFKLHSTGLNFSDINKMLTSESGFNGLFAKKWEIKDLAGTSAGREINAAKDIYYYNVIKHIGYSMAAMGGADALAVCCEDRQTAEEFTASLCKRMSFPRLKAKKSAKGGKKVEEVTAKGSEMRIYLAEYSIWEAMNKKING